MLLKNFFTWILTILVYFQNISDILYKMNTLYYIIGNFKHLKMYLPNLGYQLTQYLNKLDGSSINSTLGPNRSRKFVGKVSSKDGAASSSIMWKLKLYISVECLPHLGILNPNNKLLFQIFLSLEFSIFN